MQCRTAVLGGHVQACPDGHRARVWSNACRHRSCPQCAYLQTERWLALQQARLLACDHSHGIFPLPHALNPLGLATVSVMTTLVFPAVRDTLRPLLAAPKSLGAQPGILAALHPWSQTLVLPPHVPCVVTGGGVTPAGHWQAVRHGFLRPARVVMAVFRGKRLDAIRRAWTRGELVVPEGLRPQQGRNLLNRLGHPTKTRWHVRIVVTYLARSLRDGTLCPRGRGGPSKHARLVAWDGARVLFTCRARHEETDGARPGSQPMTVPVADFLQRWLWQVPVPQTRTVRGYGRYHATQTAALALCRAALGPPPVVVPVGLDWQTVCAPRGEAHPARCPTCGQRLGCTEVIPRGGAPPLGLAGERAACGRDTTGGRGRSVRGGGCLAVARWGPSAGREAVSEGSEGQVCG